MSSTGPVYNHRSLQPTGRTPQGPHTHARISESFEAIRQEFEAVTSELDVARSQRDDYEAKMTSQVNELNMIRRSLYELETQHSKVRQSYDDEVNRLRSEVAAIRQAGLPPRPTIGSVSASLGLRSNIGPPPPALDVAPAAGPPIKNDIHSNRDRDRELRRERQPDRDREREPHDRDNDRSIDDRDPKRPKTDRMKIDRPDQFSPSLAPGLIPTPKLPPAHALFPPAGPSSISAPLLMDESSSSSGTLAPINTGSKGGFPDDMNPHNVPPEFRKEGSDWFAIFNPKVKKVLDISLVHTLIHASVVCCVQFSSDGKYLATGCNRSAQIYDVKTGAKICVLVDDSASKSGDLYIRSVRFSPDGKLLATGAEDRQIRIWDIAKKRIRNIFDGHQQEIYSLDFSQDGRLILSGSGDKTARIWDMVDGSSKVLTINDSDSLNNDAGVTSVAISPNGKLVAAGSLDTVVRIWDAASGTLLERLRGHRDSVYSVAFTPDGKGLVSGSLDKTLKYWDVSGLISGGIKGRKEGTNGGPSVSGPCAPGGVVKKEGEKPSQCTMDFLGHKDYVLSVAVSHDGQWVVSGSKDRCVQFWDSRNATLHCMLQGHKNSVISLDLNPAGGMLATGSGDSLARIWSYNTPN